MKALALALLRRLLILVLLWVPFSVAALLAIPVALIAVLAGGPYSIRLLRAMDKQASALLGRSGDYTLSAECGSTPDCAPCKVMCAVLNLIDDNHCHDAAVSEGRLFTKTTE